MTASLLARLTPGSVNLMGVPGGSNVQIQASDVAAALAFGSLPKPAYHFGLAKYCLDAVYVSTFLKHLTHKIQKQISSNGWQDEEGRATRIAWLVLEEIGFSHKCKKCNGLGSRLNGIGLDGIIAECSSCAGTGQKRFSERKRAEIVGIPRSSWKRTWEQRVNDLYQYVLGLDDMVINHLWHQLG